MVTRNRILGAYVLLAFVAITIFYSGEANLTVRAQSSDYSTSWMATDLIVGTLRRPVTGNSQSDCVNGLLHTTYGDPAPSEIALGVAKWTVKGQISGSTKYKELWATPQLPAAFTYGGDWINGSCQNLRLIVSGNNNQTEWLSGFVQNATLTASAITFRTVGTTEDINNLIGVDSGRVNNIGKATSCQYSNRCLFATGPYSWTTFHELDVVSDGKHLNLGTIIPLKWTIGGYICEPGDNRCD